MTFDLSKWVLQPEEGEALAFGPPASGDVIIKVDPANTGEPRFAFGTERLDPGGRIRAHLHEGLEELLFIYAGRGTAIVADQEVEIVPGTTLYVPRNVWHGITNTADEPLRLTWTVCPPGLEDYFRELGTPLINGQPAPNGPPVPRDLDAVIRIAARHRTRLKLD
jgi:mannose-6-phosphate isomerase-like protein (cupin superfamily)